MKTHYLIFFICFLFSIKGYSCVSSGSTIAISGPSTVFNDGSSEFSASMTGGYIAPNTVSFQPILYGVSTDWTLERTNGSIVRSATISGRTIRWNLNLSGVAPGSYVIRAVHNWCVEAVNAPTAYNECTSIADTYPITVEERPVIPDLEPAFFVNSSGGFFNENTNISVAYAALNTGDALSSSVRTTLKFWWSEDRDVDGDDKLARTINNVSIQNTTGGFSTTNTTITTPDLDDFGLGGLGFWNFYLLLEIDPDNVIDEPGGENNNVQDDVLLTIEEPSTGGIIVPIFDGTKTKSISRTPDMVNPSIIRITDLTGKIVWERQDGSGLNLQDIPSNEVLIFVREQNEEITREKVVIE